MSNQIVSCKWFRPVNQLIFTLFNNGIVFYFLTPISIDLLCLFDQYSSMNKS